MKFHLLQPPSKADLPIFDLSLYLTTEHLTFTVCFFFKLDQIETFTKLILKNFSLSRPLKTQIKAFLTLSFILFFPPLFFKFSYVDLASSNRSVFAHVPSYISFT